MPSEGHTHDEVDHDTQSDFVESFNTTIFLDGIDMVNELKQARKKKLKKSVTKTPTRSRSTMKGEITQCIKSFKEVAGPLMESRKMTTPSKGGCQLKQLLIFSTDNVKVALHFWVSANEVLENETKLML